MADRYHKLYLAALSAFPDKQKKTVQQDVSRLWNEIKSGRKEYDTELNQLKNRANRAKSKFLNFWSTPQKPKLPQPSGSNAEVQIINAVVTAHAEVEPAAPEEDTRPEGEVEQQDSEARKETPAQQAANKELLDTSKRIADLHIVRSSVGLSEQHKKELTTLIKKKTDLEKKIKRLKSNQISSQKLRDKRKRALTELEVSHPDAAKRLKTANKPGRPPLESRDDLAGLHQVILNLVSPDSSADDRRRTEVFNSCQTLDDLKSKLADSGYAVTRTALYYRLAPANVLHRDGKRHVHTVPVKLLKPQTVARKAHIDHEFAKAVCKNIEEFACLFDPDSVFYLSQDDKAKVPLGLPVSKKQSAILMHVDYKVTLPDHDYPIGAQHKLIPSVYANCVMKDGKISFSGPTYVAIRSQKHDSSTAETHQRDFDKLIELEEFKTAAKGSDGLLKPLIFVAVDSGPDEAPNNQKTMLAWIDCFNRHDVDGIFVFSNAPGFSAYNKVERRMAPLSRDTAGIILPFDKFGSHLDNSNKTVDSELEKKNFAAAGEILASVWSESVIDDYPVVANWCPPTEERLVINNVEQQWIDNHVRQSRYLLQITRCKDLSCCITSRTNYVTVLGSRFLPPPIPIKVAKTGPQVVKDGKFGGLFQNLWLSQTTKTKVFDTYCPKMSVVKHRSGISELNRRICSKCGIYYPTLKALQSHRSECESIVFASVDDEPEDTDDEPEEINDQPAPAQPAEEPRRLNVFDRLNMMFGI